MIEHHDLVHDLPEYRQAIHELKLSNAHFARLFDDYHRTDREVRRMETDVQPTTDEAVEDAKKLRLRLKDSLVAMLRTHTRGTSR